MRRQYARMRHVPRGMHACAPRQAAVSERIEVVTADKELRRAASGVHKNVKLINPVKWCAARALVVHCSCTLQRPAFAMGTSCRWRRYLPRLKGLKSDYSNAPATDDEGGPDLCVLLHLKYRGLPSRRGGRGTSRCLW